MGDDAAPEQIETPPRRAPIRWRRWAPRAVFECALIVFSVVLALGLTNWAEDRREQARADEMQAFIRREVAANHQLLMSEAYLPHHQRLQRITSDAVMSGASTLEDLRPTFRAVTASGVHFTPLDDSVWRSVAGSSVMEHMDPEDVFRLARVYRMQEDLHMLNTAFYQQLIAIPAEMERGDPPRGALARLNMYFNDVVATETALAEAYAETLAAFDGHTSPPAAASTQTDDAAPPKR